MRKPTWIIEIIEDKSVFAYVGPICDRVEATTWERRYEAVEGIKAKAYRLHDPMGTLRELTRDGGL